MAACLLLEGTAAADPPPPVTPWPVGAVVAEATSSAGATVAYPFTVETGFVVTCDHPNPDTYPIRDTTVNCTAKRSDDGTRTFSYVVTVRDTTPPSFGELHHLTVEATSATGAAVTYSPTASDLVDGAVVPTCTPASGSTLPLGTTTVSCSAVDAHGNTAAASFEATVADTTAPSFAELHDVTVEATSAAGAVATYAVSAGDVVDGAVVPACSPASGSTFPLGTTTVSCSAVDTHGTKAVGSFKVTVADTTAPVITAPASLGTTTGDADGSMVEFRATALDAVDGAVGVACSPSSGSRFPVGATKVGCTAQDAQGNRSRLEFVITVTRQATATVSPPSAPTPSPSSARVAPALPAAGPVVNALTASARSHAVTLTWSADAATRFELVRLVGSTTVQIFDGAARTFVDTGLKNGVRYRYAVIAVGQDGRRSAQTVAEATPRSAALLAPQAGAVLVGPPALVWVRVPRASYYNVQLFRNGQKILSVWPGTHRLALKRQWSWGGRRYTLSPGDYRWYVWPGFGSHRARSYGPPLGDSAFHVGP